MSNFSSVQSFARTLSQEVSVLDIAILNAGVASTSYNTSSEGWEMSVQVNVLSTALLGILLLPKLRETASRTGTKPHVVITGSAAHAQVKAEQVAVSPNERILDKINEPSYFNPGVQYSATKLLVMYVTQALADISSKPNGEPDIIVIVTCTGLCKSDVGRTFPWFLQYPVLLFQSVFARTAEQGSRSLVSASTVGVDHHGGYWTNDVFTKCVFSQYLDRFRCEGLTYHP